MKKSDGPELTVDVGILSPMTATDPGAVGILI